MDQAGVSRPFPEGLVQLCQLCSQAAEGVNCGLECLSTHQNTFANFGNGLAMRFLLFALHAQLFNQPVESVFENLLDNPADFLGNLAEDRWQSGFF